jgi:hypothetical protein
LLFAGLVTTWLAVLVPMAARRRQPMTRHSDAALSSRVLQRPVRERRGTEEGSGMVQTAEQSPRYRPGRGGYDPEAAVLAAQARCTFRQRVVLTLVLLAAGSALVAVGLSVPEAWWVHGGVDVLLVAYLANLRRQVRSEQAIRVRRAARSAGSRPARSRTAHPAEAPPAEPAGVGSAVNGRTNETDAGRPAARRRGSQERRLERRGDRRRDRRTAGRPDTDRAPELDAYLDWARQLREAPEPPDDEPDVTEAGPAPAEPATRAEPEGEPPALPLLTPVPLPPRPAGTEMLELDDEDPELHELEYRQHWGHRRAAGQ